MEIMVGEADKEGNKVVLLVGPVEDYLTERSVLGKSTVVAVYSEYLT